MNNNKIISSEVSRKIRKLEIFTRRLLNGSLVGDSRSATKGTGFEFDQIREYAYGDDIRFIDWKASARNNKFLVKQYIEERSRTVILAVDVSASSSFGSTDVSKQDRLAEVAAVLAFVAQHGKDHVALLLFSDQVVEYIPPGNSIHHIYHLLEKLFSTKSPIGKTDISHAFKYLLSVKKRDAIVFMLSDFIDDYIGTYLMQAARRFDVIAMRCLDSNEKIIPSIGFLTIEDLETGELMELDVRDKQNNHIKKFLSARVEEQNKLFKRCGVDLFEISPENKNYLAEMVHFFRRRMMY